MRSVTLFFLLFFSTLHAAAPLELSQPHYAIGTSLEHLEDVTSALTFEEVRALPDGAFSPLGRPIASHTFTDEAYWYRFSVENKSADAARRLIWFEPAWLDTINIFVISPDGTVSRTEGGNTRPFYERSTPHTFMNYAHSFEPGVSEVYVQVMTRDPFIVAVSVMEKADFLAMQGKDTLIVGLVYGAVIAMMLYNLLLYLGIRERYQLFYVLYLFSFIVMNASYSGYTFPVFFAEQPAWQNWANSSTIFFFVFCALLFARSFLNLAQRHPRLHRVTLYLIWFVGVTALLSSLFGYRVHVALSIAFAMVISLYIFSVALLSWLRGNRTARFFLLGAASGLLGTALTAMTVMALIPYSYYTYKALEFGMVIDVILMSLAVADRVKKAQEEKLRAEMASRTDSLTGLRNRRAYREAALFEHQRQLRTGHALSVIMMDIDDFKEINDSYGHAVGDRILQSIADVVQHHCRANDYAFRMGGDEFLLMLPDTGEIQAMVLAERLKASIAAHTMEIDGRTFHVTSSMGVTQFAPEDGSVDAMVERADLAMYEDKRRGKAVQGGMPQ